MSKDFIQRLIKDKKIQPPEFLYDNINYLTIMGSAAYGVSDDNSDMDVYGIVTPPVGYVFPHTTGEIQGFGRQIQRFEQWQQHHIKDPSKNREYDFGIYNIVKYFQLLMENNPNIIDSIYTPDRCVLYIDNVGTHLRNNRDIFLHKGAIYKFRGYAYSQMSKIKNKSNSSNPKRQESIEKYSYDVKFGYHLVRLLLEAEMIANSHTLDIEINRETLKSIRKGEWSFEQLTSWFDNKMISLETVFENSTLQNTPDENKIKCILIECLEMTYGNIDNLLKISTTDSASNKKLISELKGLISKYE